MILSSSDVTDLEQPSRKCDVGQLCTPFSDWLSQGHGELGMSAVQHRDMDCAIVIGEAVDCLPELGSEVTWLQYM